jgi:hypothetical protein
MQRMSGRLHHLAAMYDPMLHKDALLGAHCSGTREWLPCCAIPCDYDAERRGQGNASSVPRMHYCLRLFYEYVVIRGPLAKFEGA